MACESNYLPGFGLWKGSLSPDVNGFRETGDPESGPARISFCLG